MSDARGFTLIEIVVVISLLGVVAAVSVPAMLSGMRRSRVEELSSSMMQLVQTTRSAAANRATAATLTIDTERDRYWIETDSGNGTVVIQSGVIEPKRALSGNEQRRRLSVRFSADGIASADSLRLRVDGNAATISIDLWTGQPHVR